MKYWWCTCCGHLMVTSSRSDGTAYQCPQCVYPGRDKCTHEGPYYEEIDAERFMVEAKLKEKA